MKYSRMSLSEESLSGFLLIIVMLIAAAFVGGMVSLIVAVNTGWLSRASEGQLPLTFKTAEPDYQNQDALVTAVWEKTAPAVVSISNISTQYYLFDRKQEVEQGIGSGAVISGDGYIVTNYHVIAGAEKIKAGLFDGRVMEAKIVGSDSRSDLAVLKIEGHNLDFLVFADSDQIKVGQTAIAIGNPGGNDFARSATLGIISGVDRQLANAEGQQFNLIQTDAAINPGNSGGPLVNIRGELIGINSIKIATQAFEGMGFAIPANLVREIAVSLINYGRVIRPALGVEILADVSDQIARENGLAVDYGVVVSPVGGGAAEKAGLKRYDIIIAINDTKIADSYILQEKIFSMAIGEKVRVRVIRANKEQVFEVRLEQLADE